MKINYFIILVTITLTSCNHTSCQKSQTPLTYTPTSTLYIEPLEIELFVPDSTYYDSNPSFEFLFQRWMHSYEEDLDYIALHYRPSDYKKYPPSMYRSRLNFYKDGTCEYLFLHPSDIHEMRKATWNLDRNDPEILRIFYQERDKASIYRIKKIEFDELVLERLKAG